MYKNLKENYPLYEVRTTESFRALLDEGAELFGDKAAFRFKVKGGEIKSVSYREFRDEVDAFGTGLYELGLGKAHIAVIGENCYGWARAYFTVLATEGVVIPIDKDLSDEETQYILDFSDAEAVICTKNSESKLDRLLPSLPKLKTVICLGTPAEGKAGTRPTRWPKRAASCSRAATSGSPKRPSTIMSSRSCCSPPARRAKARA